MPARERRAVRTGKPDAEPAPARLTSTEPERQGVPGG
jgi:hypothetical protein